MIYIVFEKYYKGVFFRSNCLGWFAGYRTQFLTDLFKDPFLSSVYHLNRCKASDLDFFFTCHYFMMQGSGAGLQSSA